MFSQRYKSTEKPLRNLWEQRVIFRRPLIFSRVFLSHSVPL